MKFALLSILFFGFIACKTPSDNKLNENKISKASFAQIGKANIGQPIKKVDYSKYEGLSASYQNEHSWYEFSTGTFEKTTFLYDSNSLDAKIIDTLPFKSPVKILSEGPDFFLVWTQQNKNGYLKKTDVYLHSIINHYLFGISKYGTNDNISCTESQLKVIKVNDKKEIIDEFYDTIAGNDYDIKFIVNSALKNARGLFYLSYTCYDGVGIVINHFIVDNGQKLSRLIKTSGMGDGGHSRKNTVYLPVRLRNSEKIVLAKNGVLSIDKTTAKPKIHSYPNNLDVPIEELIVVEDKSVKRLSEDAKSNKQVTIHSTTFYKWNGTKIKKVKTIKSK